MIVFITGGVKNGKSTLAQRIALDLAKGGKRYYVATMLPVDEEDRDRICHHRKDREGMGFETLEQGRDILSCLNEADAESTFLLDSTTALLMNEMFPAAKNYQEDEHAARRCLDGVERFVQSVKNAVVVSDYIYGDAQRYDAVTERYRQGLADMDRMLAALADTVIEMVAGSAVIQKGRLWE